MSPSPPNPPRKLNGTSSRRIFLSTTILIIAILYRIYLHDFLVLLFSVNRVIQPIEDFPAYECQKLSHPLLAGCEDIWLDGSGRKLYAACGDIQGRKGWSPGGDKLNVSARRGSNWVSVLDIDHPGSDGLYGLRKVKIGNSYTGDLDLHGFDVKEVHNGVLRFWMINHRPPVNGDTGELLAADQVGANSTIEIFDLDHSRETLELVKTIVSDAVVSPNNLAVEDDGNGFLITNDHTRKSGALKQLEIIAGGGSVARCRTDSGECRIVAEKGFHIPNGITRGQDGLFYVVQGGAGKVSVHELVDGEFRRVSEVDTGILMDNLSVDAEGNIIAAAFPDLMGMARAFDHPEEMAVAATILRIKKAGEVEGQGQYVVEKVIEDKEGKMLSAITVAAYDVESRRLFTGGIITPFITVCQQRA